MMRGCFITIEGGEGAGKSSQIIKLEQALAAKNIAVLRTREPGGSSGAEAIRNLLLHNKDAAFDAVSETALFMAARRDHVEKIIKPALAAGKWVLCDRYLDSTIAYQGYASGLGVGYIESMYLATVGNFWPDLTIILDIDPADGLKRAKAVSNIHDRFEAEPIAFHHVLRDGFKEIAGKNPGRYAIINASGTQEQVHELIWNSVRERLLNGA